MSKQPEALRLADALESGETFDVGSSAVAYGWIKNDPTYDAADELRSLYDELQNAKAHIEALQDAVKRAENANRYSIPTGLHGL